MEQQELALEGSLRVVVVATAASTGGALSILRSLHQYLIENPTEHEWVFLVSDQYVEEGPGVHVQVLPGPKRSWVHRLGFELLYGEKVIHKWNPDVVLSLQDMLPWGLSCRKVVYVHQSLPFQTEVTFSFFKRAEAQLAVIQHMIGRLIKRSMSEADVTIVQADWMRQAILEQTDAPPEQVVVIPPSQDELGIRTPTSSFDSRLFVYPTSTPAYKNNQCVFDASQLLHDEGYADVKVEMTIEGTSPSPHVDLVGVLPRSALLDRLGAGTLIFPSLIESSPLPLTEAKALGCPILAADLPYAHEVLRGYSNARFFDPKRPEQLAALMRAVIEGAIGRIDGEVVGELGGRGWRELLDVIESIGDRS